MMSSQILRNFSIFKSSKRLASKIAVQLDSELVKKIENEEIKPRHHPGLNKPINIKLPRHLIHGLLKSVEDFPIKALISEGIKISRYIRHRHLPPENTQIRTKIREIESELDVRFPKPDFKQMNEEEISHWQQKRENIVKKNLKQKLYLWKPLEYDKFKSLCYAFGRSAQEYTILYKILNEISRRDSNFRPRSYFDFGSGIGTGMWATSEIWKNSIYEYYNVDSSRDMNDLSELILRDGNINKVMYLKNVFYRQFLPAGDQNKYNLVVSAFSLFDLPNKRSRNEVLVNLWKKCSDYMVIVEEGTKSGFEVVTEARDLILSLNESEKGHVFSPCPHDYACPKISKSEKESHCNFGITYDTLPIGKTRGQAYSIYSYVVLKKGIRNKDDTDNCWPRLISPTLVRARHTICRMCTAKGNLQEIVFTAAKHGKLPYRCARYSRWGDRLPINFDETEIKDEPDRDCT